MTMHFRSELDDKFLTQSFYRNVFQRFCQACDPSARNLLKECSFGIAPSQAGINTFFIVASSSQIAEALVPEIDNLLKQVKKILAGVEQIAICFIPENTKKYYLAQPISNSSDSEFMLGQFFSLSNSHFEEQ